MRTSCAATSTVTAEKALASLAKGLSYPLRRPAGRGLCPRQLLEQVPLLCGQVLRQQHVHLDVEIAAATFAQPRHALPPQPEDPSVLGFRRELERHRAGERWHLALASQHARRQLHLGLRMQIVAAPLEQWVRPNSNHQEKIARLASPLAALALPRGANTHAFADASGDLHLHAAGLAGGVLDLQDPGRAAEGFLQ